MSALKYFSLFLLLAFTVLPDPAPAARQPENVIADEDVPYGVASAYLYGHYQLADGNVDEALRNLHFAYRTLPDVPQIAWDFQEALVAGQYFKDALEVLDKLVADWPETTIYYLQRSHVFLQLGNEKKALADLRQLKKLGIINLDVVVGEATILAGMGKADQALDVCKDGLRTMPEHGPRLYLTMSVILDQEGRQSELPDLLDEAIKSYPDSPQLHDIKIRSLLTVGREGEALNSAIQADKHFNDLFKASLQGTAMDDQSESGTPATSYMPPSFVVELADTYVQQGNLEKAMAILDPLYQGGNLGKEPSLWLARLHLGSNHIKSGLEIVDSILEQWPNTGQAWFIRGRAQEAAGEYEAAILDYAKGAQYAPEDVQVRLGYIRGMLLAWENDLQHASGDEAQKEKFALLHKEALATKKLISPEDSEGQLILGYALRSVDELEMAVVAFRNAATLEGLTIPATLQMSVCYDELGDGVMARAVLEELNQKFPDDPEVANSLGYYLAEKGTDLEFAFTLIEQALKTGPGTGAYLDSMGWVLYQMGKNDDAFDYMIQAVNVLPDDPIILEHLGMVLLKMGQTAESEEMLRRALMLGGDKDRLEAQLNQLQSSDDSK